MSELIIRASDAGRVVGWPGAPSDGSAIGAARAAYLAEPGARVSADAAGAYLADCAATLDLLVKPEQYMVRRGETSEVEYIFPRARIASLGTLLAGPTDVPVVGMQSAVDVLRTLDPDAVGLDAHVRDLRFYALAQANLLRELDADPKVQTERTGGIIEVIAVAAVIVAVAALDEYFSHLDHVAQVEADASVRRTREVTAAASRDAAERVRVAISRTPPGRPIDWGAMPPPTANEQAARGQIEQRAQSEWSVLSRTIAETTSSLVTLAEWGAVAWVGYQLLKGRD